MEIIILVIVFVALFSFDLWFGGLLTKEIEKLENLYIKLRKNNFEEFQRVDRYYGREIDEYMHKSPESFPLSLITNFIDLVKVNKLQDRVHSSL